MHGAKSGKVKRKVLDESFHQRYQNHSSGVASTQDTIGIRLKLKSGAATEPTELISADKNSLHPELYVLRWGRPSPSVASRVVDRQSARKDFHQLV